MHNLQINKTYSLRMKSLALLGGVLLASAASAATISVPASSNYFVGWQMAVYTTPVPTPVAGTPINASVGGLPFTINTVGPAPVTYATWSSSTSASLMSSTDFPAAIGVPTAPGNVWEVGGGEIAIKFPTPMPKGTTLFSHDFDRNDAVEYRFYRCDGSQIDATGVDFLQIATANNPTQTPPVAGAADSFWKLASVANVGLLGTTSGLVVNGADVCEIRAKELGLPGHTTIDYMLGMPPAAPLAVPDTGSTETGVPVTIDIRANDTTTQPGTVTLALPTITLPPVNGSVTVDGSGSAVYTPNPSFVGTDTFTYQVCTVYAVSVCEEATVTVTVQAKPVVPPTTPDATPVPANSTWALLLAVAGLLGLTLRRSRQ